MTPESESGLALQAMLAEQLLAGAQETERVAWELARFDHLTAAVVATRERMNAEITLTLGIGRGAERQPLPTGLAPHPAGVLR
jgi:hypothetical protein